MAFFKVFINYLIGYEKIEVNGYYIERFINECIHKGILMWKIERLRSILICTNIAVNDIDKAKQIAEKNQCKIVVKEKRGLPFFIKKHKNRKYFFVMLILVIIVIFTLSRFIWNIEIEGISEINKNEIVELIKEEGLEIGKLKSKIDVDKIVNKVRLKREDIAWIGIDLKGTNAIVKVVEAEQKPDIIDEYDYCNIVAKKDAIVLKISAQNGTAMVEEGTEVHKGDILIAGWMEGKFTDKNYVNANGEVKAKVYYSQYEKIDKKEVKREQTGNKNKKIALKFNNFQINFYKRLSKFQIYDTIETVKKLKISSNFYLPINIITYTNYEVREIELEHSYEDAKNLGEATAQAKLDELMQDESVVNKVTKVTEYPNYYSINVTYEVVEDIGTKEKIEV